VMPSAVWCRFWKVASASEEKGLCKQCGGERFDVATATAEEEGSRKRRVSVCLDVTTVTAEERVCKRCVL
jgi:hypothetical protein